MHPDRRYVIVGPGETVWLTPRGRRLYRVAMLIHGLDPELVDRVRTCEALRELALRVKDVRVSLVAAEVERTLRGGEIPARSRAVLEAVLYGTLEDFHGAVERQVACKAAGGNVIPLPRLKSK